ncbi:Transcription factor bHLH85 [Bienertia sinuspersici]
MGAFFDGEWESLCNIFTFETPDFGPQFLEHPTHNDSSFFSSSIDNNECFFYDPKSIISDLFSDDASDTTSYNNPSPIPNNYENCHFSLPNNDTFLPMNNNISMMDQENHASFVSASSVEDDNRGSSSPLNQEVQVKRKCNAPEMQADEHKLKAIPKKRARLSKDKGNRRENGCVISEEQNTDDETKESEQTSEVDISTSKELISENSKGKKRASRGTATDPQSLYARKRRERINERLRILQNLVPNGTKVDISTMLEEAVSYVKFLQLQIQLLSSDELWMYAPVAYNGVDISLYKRISPFLLP